MLSPVPSSRVKIHDAFWAPRQEINRTTTLPLIYRHCGESGRIGALKLDWKPGQPNPPQVAWDSDLAKWMEAASSSLRTHPDPRLESQLDELIGLLAKAQRPDGYLNSYYTAVEPGKRWSNLRDQHELYCAGHLIEAAVAHFETTGQRNFLDVICRYADHIDSVFGSEPEKKRGYCGHPEIELALVKLFRATGQERYLRLSQFFIEERGRQPNYFDLEATARGEDPKNYWAKTHEYTSSHSAVRNQTRAVGHAVRALYLYCGMADIARETRDKTLLETCERLWESIYHRQSYITGGIGVSRQNEGFTFDYDLPNESAYAETCAAIASVFWNHRLLQFHRDSRHADEIERALYNGVLSGVSADGRSFFYVNPLQVHADEINPDDPYLKAHRAGWFDCACCPPNVARLLASLGQYVYSESDQEIAIHLYVQSSAEMRIAGKTVALHQETEYPWKGKIRINIEPQSPVDFCLSLRLPGWCREADLFLNGKLVAAPLERGYICVRRKWKRGDRIELRLFMPIERVHAHPNVRANAGRVALQRGPIIYCVESIDVGVPLSSLILPRGNEFLAIYEKQMFGGTTTIQGEALVASEAGWDGKLYRFGSDTLVPTHFKAIPYSLWGNRDASEMAVWLREG